MRSPLPASARGLGLALRSRSERPLDAGVPGASCKPKAEMVQFSVYVLQGGNDPCQECRPEASGGQGEREVYCILPDAPVLDALKMMFELEIGALPVIGRGEAVLAWP